VKHVEYQPACDVKKSVTIWYSHEQNHMRDIWFTPVISRNAKTWVYTRFAQGIFLGDRGYTGKVDIFAGRAHVYKSSSTSRYFCVPYAAIKSKRQAVPLSASNLCVLYVIFIICLSAAGRSDHLVKPPKQQFSPQRQTEVTKKLPLYGVAHVRFLYYHP
jgi:hypothetical protein